MKKIALVCALSVLLSGCAVGGNPKTTSSDTVFAETDKAADNNFDKTIIKWRI